MDGDSVPAFARSVIEDVRGSDYVDIVCFVRDSSIRPQTPAKRSLASRVLRALFRRSNWRKLLYLLYLRWIDARARARLEPDPEREINCADLMAGTLTIDVQPVRAGPVDRIAAADVGRISALGLDVMLRFGFRILRGDILTAAGTANHNHFITTGDYASGHRARTAAMSGS